MTFVKTYWIPLAAGVCMFVATNSAVAQTARAGDAGVETQLLLCAKRATDSARLACYDGLAESLRSRIPGEQEIAEESVPTPPVDARSEAPERPAVDPETGVPVVAQSPAPAKRNPETFDTNVQQKQSIRVMIEKTRRNARGDWYFYFDNDEVWKQIDSRNRRIPPLPVAATVSRGIFSSHKLHIDGEVWAMKIRRVK